MHRWFFSVCTVSILVLTLLLAVPPSHAAWPTNPNDAVEVASIGNAQQNIVAISDGDDGALVFWEDHSPPTYTRILGSRILKDGTIMWAAIVAAVASVDQFNPAVVSDGAGGAIVVWEDHRNGGLNGADLYAERLDPNGTSMWSIVGVPVVTASFGQNLPKIVSDGAGGAVIAWTDYRTVVPDVYAQRLDSNGVRDWLVSGVLMCGAAGDQTNLQLIANPLQVGSAIAVWEDTRATKTFIAGQLLDSAGNLFWGPDGLPVVSSPYYVANPRLANVADGNFAVALEDTLFGDQIVRHFVFNTTLTQLAGGIAVSQVPGWSEHLVDMVPDETGGVLLNYYTDAGGAHVNHIQRSSSGLYIHYATDYDLGNTIPVVAADGAGGAYAAFASNSLVMERLSSTGTEVWDPNGIPVSISAGPQVNPVLVRQSDGSVIVIWEDGRHGNGGPDVYANRVDRHGYLGDPSPVMTYVTDVPDDQGGVVYVEFTRSYLDEFDKNEIWGYGVWRAPVGTPFITAATSGDIESRIHSAVAMGSSEEVARRMASQGWEQVSYISAAYQESYSAVIPTYANSTGGGGSNLMSVKAVTNGAGGSIWWESDPMDGYSEDNLSPAPPLVLTATRAGDDVQLEWSPSGENEIDFSEYIIYRGTSPSVTPEPLNFLSETPDTMLTDTSADPATEYYYVATARDVHENESETSNEAMVSGTATGVGDTPALTALRVSNFPNPFNGATEIRVGVPERSDVTVHVYDVAGRLVFEREVRGAGAGWHSVTFDGRTAAGEALPGGVYFARVTAGTFTQSHKMVLLK